MGQGPNLHSSSESTVETIIQPPKSGIDLDLRELWRYRELVGFFAWRDIISRYKQTLLGISWAIVVPFTQMVIFTVIFGELAGLPTDGVPPAIFYYAALLPWTYFAQSLSRTGQCLVGNRALLTKVYFPRLIVPIATCVTPLVQFVIAFGILALLMFWYGVAWSWWAALLPALLLVAVGTALGMGLLLSAMNVKYRDVGVIIPFLSQLWMYVTIIYPFSEIRERLGGQLGNWVYLYGLNPLAGVVEGFRWCLLHKDMFIEKTTRTVIDGQAAAQALLGNQRIEVRSVNGEMVWSLIETVKVPADPPFMLLAWGVPVMALMLSVGLAYFQRMERMFADIV